VSSDDPPAPGPGRLDELVAAGAETGLQVAVHHRGHRVVDAVAGVADGTTGRPVTSQTLFFSFSTAKGVAALIAHLLVKNGLVGYDTSVAEGWPEFGVHGKETATLRQVLTHTVGVPAMPGGLGPTDLADWPRVCAAIAGAQPRWRPGTRTGYHSYTFGFLVGEIARRVTGQPVRRLLHDWVAAPLGIVGELYFGVPPTELARIARLEGAEPNPAEPVEHDRVLAPWERQPRASMGNNPDFLQADVPSVGTFTARGDRHRVRGDPGRPADRRRPAGGAVGGRLRGNRPGLRQPRTAGPGVPPRPHRRPSGALGRGTRSRHTGALPGGVVTAVPIFLSALA
jgi:CubicO group peptidase (beta-lactamase class C family)